MRIKIIFIYLCIYIVILLITAKNSFMLSDICVFRHVLLIKEEYFYKEHHSQFVIPDTRIFYVAVTLAFEQVKNLKEQLTSMELI